MGKKGSQRIKTKETVSKYRLNISLPLGFASIVCCFYIALRILLLASLNLHICFCTCFIGVFSPSCRFIRSLFFDRSPPLLSRLALPRLSPTSQR